VHIFTVILLVWRSTANKFLSCALTTTVFLLPETATCYLKNLVTLHAVVDITLLLLWLRRCPAPLSIALLTFAAQTDIPPPGALQVLLYTASVALLYACSELS